MIAMIQKHITIKRVLHIVFLLCLTTGTEAQQVFMDLFSQMSAGNPQSVYRSEYKCVSLSSDSVRVFKRYDCHTTKKELGSEWLSRLTDTFDAESKQATESTRYIGHHNGGDTLSYTLIYQSSKASANSDTFITHTANRNFSADRGYALLDVLNEQVQMQVSTINTLQGKAERTNPNPIDEAYCQLATRAGVTTAEVQYTGSKGSFTFQRKKGEGWTRGRRLTLQHATQQDFQHIMDLMASFFDKKQELNIILYPEEGIFFIEETKQLYIVRLNTDGRLFFLKAQTDGDICIPSLWTRLDYFDNGIEQKHK